MVVRRVSDDSSNSGVVVQPVSGDRRTAVWVAVMVGDNRGCRRHHRM